MAYDKQNRIFSNSDESIKVIKIVKPRAHYS